MRVLSYGSPLNTTPLLIDEDAHPILFHLARSWSCFLSKFWKEDDNYKKCWIMYNPDIRAENNNTSCLDFRVIARDDFSGRAQAMGLRYCDIIERRHIRPMDQIPCPLNGNGYLRMTAACLRYRRPAQTNPCLGIEDFV